RLRPLSPTPVPYTTLFRSETELAVILGTGGREVPVDKAMTLVGGYSVFFDITARDLQAKAREDGSPWTAAKGFDTFAPMSEPIPDRKSTRLNSSHVAISYA